jgi:hypothetical protein
MLKLKTTVYGHRKVYHFGHRKVYHPQGGLESSPMEAGRQAQPSAVVRSKRVTASFLRAPAAALARSPFPP